MFFAKAIKGYKGSYKYHIKKCYEVFKNEFDYKRELLSWVLSSSNTPLDEFERNMSVAILLHDSGKLSSFFQDYIKRLINKNDLSGVKYFRHEVLSSQLLLSVLGRSGLNYALFAVLGHHKNIDNRLSEFKDEQDYENNKDLQLPKESIQYALQLTSALSGYRFNNDINISIELLWQVINHFISISNLEKLSENYINEREFRRIYALARGMLMYCDWYASSDTIWKKTNSSCKTVLEAIKDKVQKDGLKYQERPFHKKCRNKTGDALVIAPTGAGKTEAAILWALNKKYGNIIFLMPTKVTSNSIYNRLSKYYFEPELCGLAHSSISTFFNTKENYEDNDNLKFMLLKFKAFIPQIMVSTVDQLLTLGANIGHWCLKQYALLGASVIFDEIQTYDRYTLGLITSLIEEIKAMKGRVMLMSATMPQVLKNHFLNVLSLSEENVIYADEFMKRRKCNFTYIETNCTGIRNQVIYYVQSGKRVCVIVNDVKSAQNEYKYYKEQLFRGCEEKILCLHSYFISKDRNQKEKDLFEHTENYNLVIATQVMEVSLDVSFEIIFSEAAPMECLIQRAGRCNRKSEFENAQFIVFSPSDVTKKYIYKDNEILKRTIENIKSGGKFSEEELIQILDNVYKGYDIYNNDYNKGRHLYKEVAQKCFFLDVGVDEEKIDTRIFNMTTIGIIPMKFYDDVVKLYNNKRYSDIPLYEVSVPLSRLKEFTRHKDDNIKRVFYYIDYDSEIGISFEKHKSFDEW